MHPALYIQTKTCPVCERRFTLTRPRLSACVVSARESDFRVVYTGLDPNLYSVWACPYCGYAASETTFDTLENGERQRVREALAGQPVPPEAAGERTPAGAVAVYERAIELGEVRRLSPSNLAGLELKLAWILRGLGEVEREREHLATARDLYRTAFDHERLGTAGKMSEAMVAYLVGELSRRIGEYAVAVQWFSRLASDPRTKEEPQILNLAREQWYVARRQASGDEAAEEPSAAGSASGASGAEAGDPDRAVREESQAKSEAVPAGMQSGPPSLSAIQIRARLHQGKVSAMVPLYRDQVDWLQRVVALSDEAGGKVALPDIVRAALDAVMLNVPPERLAGRDEEDLRRRLAGLLHSATGAAGSEEGLG